MSSIIKNFLRKLSINMNYFSVNLKTLRDDKKLSQSQLAKELGVSNGMISFWENNIYEPTATNIITIANYFNVSIDDLLLTEIAV